MQPRPFFAWQALDFGDLIVLARPDVADLQEAHCPKSLPAVHFGTRRPYGVSGQLSHVAGTPFRDESTASRYRAFSGNQIYGADLSSRYYHSDRILWERRCFLR